MGIKINQYALERLTFGDDDYYDIDYFDGANYQTAKIKGSTIKAGIQAGITGDNIYSIDGVLTANRTLDGGLFDLIFNNLGKIQIVSDQLGVDNVVFLINNNASNIGFNIEDSVTSQSNFMVKNGVVRINDDYDLPLTDGTAGQIIKTDGAGVSSWETVSIGNFSQTSDGVVVVNTTTETSIIGTGVGSLTVPANTFQVGDSFHLKIGGLMSSIKDDELILRVKNGGTVLASTGNFRLEDSTTDGWEAEIDFTIRIIGATGSIVTNGNFCHNKTLDKKYAGTVFQDTKAIDTTIVHTLDITAEWVQADVADSIQASNCVLYKTF